MSVRGASKTPKALVIAEKLLSGLKPGELANLGGVQKIMTGLEKKDWAPLVGVMMTLLITYIGTDEEKAEIGKTRQEVRGDQAKKDARGGLKNLKVKVEGEEEGAEDEAENKIELRQNPELGDGSDYVIIGDSAANGMHISYNTEVRKRPTFIGRDGMTTFKVLARLEAERGNLKGKKKAMIYCAGNNIFGTPTDKLVEHMVAMAKICNEAEIPEIIVNTQFPPISDYRKNIGHTKFKELKIRNEALRKALLKAYRDGEFPAGTRVVDLTTPFSYQSGEKKGEMRTEYVDPNATDYLHPWFAYKPALDYMKRRGESNVV